jgi:two-component system, response regulator / RNA-binding antiterminator
LIKQRHMSEPDAYKWLRGSAMSRGRRVVDVASDLIKSMEGNAG